MPRAWAPPPASAALLPGTRRPSHRPTRRSRWCAQRWFACDVVTLAAKTCVPSCLSGCVAASGSLWEQWADVCQAGSKWEDRPAAPPPSPAPSAAYRSS
eukprot:scaffold32597_cov40-Phaeocystis_antarctica.AAC.1